MNIFCRISWIRHLLLVLIINLQCLGNALPAKNSSDCVENENPKSQYQLLANAMADTPQVAPTDEVARSQRSLFKTLFKNIGLNDLFDDNGRELCVNCCNNNNNNDREYDGDNVYSDLPPQAPAPPPFDPLYTPFQPFAPLQPLPPFRALSPLQPFKMLQPIIGGISGINGGRGGISGGRGTYVSPPPPPTIVPVPPPAPIYKEPTPGGYDDGGEGYTPKPPLPSVPTYEAEALKTKYDKTPPAPTRNDYKSIPAPNYSGGNIYSVTPSDNNRGAPQVIYQPIIFVSPQAEQKKYGSNNRVEVDPLYSVTNDLNRLYGTSTPSPTNSYITPYTPAVPTKSLPNSPQLPEYSYETQTTDSPTPPQNAGSYGYTLSPRPTYTAIPPDNINNQNQYQLKGFSDDSYQKNVPAQIYHKSMPPSSGQTQGSTVVPGYGGGSGPTGITSVTATYTIVTPYNVPASQSVTNIQPTPYSPAPSVQNYNSNSPLVLSPPCELTLADQPYRDCPELFNDYQRQLKPIRSV